jgi:hypothetical protein
MIPAITGLFKIKPCERNNRTDETSAGRNPIKFGD